MSAQTLELEITGIEEPSPTVRSFTLAAPDRRVLPSFVPGSHVVLECGDRANAYSLTSDPIMPYEYTVSVLKLEQGQGGSRWLHERRVGERLTARPPRSAFAPQLKARKHLLIAAGIGVTPIISLLRAAMQYGHEVEVIYAHKPGYGTHCRHLQAIAPQKVTCLTSRADFLTHYADVVGSQPIGTHLYCCGPEPFLDTVTSMATAAGWPAGRVHTERFGIDALDPGDPFEVHLTESGDTLTVPSGVSLLETLEKHGFQIPNMCRQGVCGECVLSVNRGRVLHRDHYLLDEEKQSHAQMMCCVSRAEPAKDSATTPRLEIAL